MQKISVFPYLTAFVLMQIGAPFALSQTYTSGEWTYAIENGGAVIFSYGGTNRSVDIPSQIDGFTVRKVGNGDIFGGGGMPVFPFANNSITNITIPNSVRHIAGSAFVECLGLLRVTIGSSVETIGGLAFENAAIESIEIPASVTHIGSLAFWDCPNLKRVLFLGNAPSADGAFQGSTPTLYFLNGASGWSDTMFGGLQTVMLGPIPTIIAAPTASPVVLGQSLASSILSGGQADVPGEFGFTDPTIVPPIGASTHTVTFVPRNSGGFVSVTTNVSVVALGTNTDSDGDGLVDAAEHLLSYLGFDWQSTQPEKVTGLITVPNSSGLVTTTFVTSNPSAFHLFTQQQFDSNRTEGQSDVINNPLSYGLYTSNSIMDLRMNGLMVQKSGSNAVVSLQPQTTTDLTQPFTNNGTPIIHSIPMPGNKGFLRINAKPEQSVP